MYFENHFIVYFECIIKPSELLVAKYNTFMLQYTYVFCLSKFTITLGFKKHYFGQFKTDNQF